MLWPMLSAALAGLALSRFQVGSVVPGMLGVLIGLGGWWYGQANPWLITLWALLTSLMLAAWVTQRGGSNRGWMPVIALLAVLVIADQTGWTSLVQALIAVLTTRLLVGRPGTPVVEGWTLLSTVCGYGLFALVCVLMVPLAPLVALRRQPQRRLTRLLRLGALTVIRGTPGMAWRIIGPADAVADARIIVANHESTLDILGGCALPGAQRTMLAKPWVFRTPVLGWAARAGGIRSTADFAAEDFQQRAEVICPGSLLVFPEGTRSRDGELLRFRPGAFVLARALGCAVVPVVHAGTRAGITPGDWWIRPTAIASRVLPAIVVPDDGSLRAVAETCRSEIASARFALVRDLLLAGSLTRRLALRCVGFSPASRWRMQQEEQIAAWRPVVAAATAQPGAWLIVGADDGLLPAVIRLLLPAAPLILIADSDQLCADARAAWCEPARDRVLDQFPMELPALAGCVLTTELTEADIAILLPVISATTTVLVAAEEAAAWAARLGRQAGAADCGLITLT